MKTQKINERLQSAYEKMVEDIESLINNDGKKLKEAVEIAEEKLNTWQELTKEEAQKISNEVKSDLQSVGETLHGAKDAYKEQFKLDTAYLTDSIWEKISKIADASNEEFNAFSDNLKELAHKATTDDHANEHKDHLRWNSDHEFWLDEIKVWKNDHQHALVKLQAIEESIKKHTDALDEHAQVIHAHEEQNKEHEEVMQGTELDPSSRVLEAEDNREASIHRQESIEHAKHAALHDSLKKGHRKMMVLIDNLYNQVVK